MTGRKHTEETKAKIRAAQKGLRKPWKSGKLAHNWRGGKYKYVKRQVLERDAYTCKSCGHCEPEIMEVDHLTEKSAGGSNEVDNLQTLCPNCHARKTRAFRKTRVPNGI